METCWQKQAKKRQAVLSVLFFPAQVQVRGAWDGGLLPSGLELSDV